LVNKLVVPYWTSDLGHVSSVRLKLSTLWGVYCACN